jgi:AraC-like DNA-binding protein
MQSDRLSTLISRFALSVSISEPGAGNMRVLGKSGSDIPCLIEFLPMGGDFKPSTLDVLIEADVQFGGSSNPLISALPKLLSHSATNDDQNLLLQVFIAEAKSARCGSGSALNRLAEVLIIHILRAQIEMGTATPGLLAGLSDPKISRAIVAMHDKPGQAWRNNDLADIAGMSLSRFSDVFRFTLGETPQSYLRRWRLTLARQDLDGGERVSTIARRYGYASSEALAHAFQRQFGNKPTAFRSKRAA